MTEHEQKTPDAGSANDTPPPPPPPETSTPSAEPGPDASATPATNEAEASGADAAKGDGAAGEESASEARPALRKRKRKRKKKTSEERGAGRAPATAQRQAAPKKAPPATPVDRVKAAFSELANAYLDLRRRAGGQRLPKSDSAEVELTLKVPLKSEDLQRSAEQFTTSCDLGSSSACSMLGFSCRGVSGASRPRASTASTHAPRTRVRCWLVTASRVGRATPIS